MEKYLEIKTGKIYTLEELKSDSYMRFLAQTYSTFLRFMEYMCSNPHPLYKKLCS